jgi:hypothetical protein
MNGHRLRIGATGRLGVRIPHGFRLRIVLVSVLAAVALIAPATAQSRGRNSSTFSVQPDLRLCPAPFCGGVFVSLLNHRLTRCPDGTEREICHLADADWSPLGLNPDDVNRFQQALFAGRGLVRAELRPGRNVPGFGDLGLLVVTEGWIAASDRRPRGVFFRVTDLGFVCVTSPCFNLRQAVLNSATRRDISELDLSRAGASAATLDAALRQLSAASLIVAGRNRVVPATGPAGNGLELVASQFYLRVAPSPRAE